MLAGSYTNVLCLRVVDTYCVATFHVAYMLMTSNLESLEEVFLHSFPQAKFGVIDLGSGDIAPPAF